MFVKVLSGLLCLALFGLMISPVVAASPSSAFFDGIGKTALATGAAPGIAMAVIYKGTVVYAGGFGSADVARNVAVTLNTRFAIGSLSKQFTAAAIMLLVRERKIALDDKLARYVPSLPNAGSITLRMLLGQRSGLHNYPLTTEHAWPMQGVISLQSIIAILATDKPDFQPGTQWEYSNTNYTALAAVVEKVSGVPLATFLHSRIFGPLHMTDSGFGYAAQQRGRMAVGYVSGQPELPTLSLDLYSGAGAVVSSAHDMALWDIALMHASVLPRAYLASAWSAGASMGTGSDRYTMGWMITHLAGHREVWHNGLAPGAGGYCYNAIFPDDDLAVVVLTNGFGAQGLPEGMVQEVAAGYGIGTASQAAVAPTVAPDDDPAVDTLARRFWDQLGSGNVDSNKLTTQFAAAMTPALLVQVGQSLRIMGKLRSFTYVGKSQTNGLTGYRYALVFASGVQHEWDVALAPDGKIAGSQLVR